MAGKTPATSFIGLAVGKDADRQPGPGTHDNKKESKVVSGVMGEKRQVGSIYKVKTKMHNAGPGSYEVKGMGNVKRPHSASTFGGRGRDKKRDGNPGPGAYDANFSQASTFGFGTEKRMKPPGSRFEKKPGPGTY